MRISLTGGHESYYMRQDPFGASGDFITAPEISQMFGEMIGVWCADIWFQLGRPDPFTLIELGPGRGTLMKDIFRTVRVAPGFASAARIVFVEASPVLSAVQAQTMGQVGCAPPRWLESLDAVTAEGPVIVVANEFFDALPVRQLIKSGACWRERCVGLDVNGQLVFGASADAVPPSLVPQSLQSSPTGTVIEASAAVLAIAGQIGALIRSSAGAVLAIDYGYEGPAAGDTLQALKSHAPVDVLAAPGEADLTCHVDFTALGGAFKAAGLHVLPLQEQGALLHALGMAERRDMLLRHATSTQAEQLASAYERLTSADGMGSLFKSICAVWPDSIRPAGFGSR
jgi:NADH dehydrogenase [ubiquinone] 1 alpha subcomplex assembly factor 7